MQNKKFLWGRKVNQIEEKFNKPLETILNDMNNVGLSFRKQAIILGLTPNQVMNYYRKMGLAQIKPDKKSLTKTARLEEDNDKNCEKTG